MALVAIDPEPLDRYVDRGIDLTARTARLLGDLGAAVPAPTGGPADPLAARVEALCRSARPALQGSLGVLCDMAATVARKARRADRGAAPATTPLVVGARAVGGLVGLPSAGASPDPLPEPWSAVLRLGRVAVAALPELAEALGAMTALRPLLAVLEGPLGRLSPAAGAFLLARDLGEIASDGPPVQAWHDLGVGYLADVARAASDGSLLAAELAPSPLTFGIAAGTTLTWLQLHARDEGWPVPILVPPLPPIFIGPGLLPFGGGEGAPIGDDLRHVGEALDRSSGGSVRHEVEDLRRMTVAVLHGRPSDVAHATLDGAHDLVEGAGSTMLRAADSLLGP